MKSPETFLGIIVFIALTVLISIGVHTFIPPTAHGESLVYDTKHCYLRCPGSTSTSGNLLIRRELYMLSYNPTRKMADWVAYRIDPSNFRTTDTPKRSRRFRSDPLISWRDGLEPSDYKRANQVLHVDRGHLVPLASVAGHPRWYTVNYLSNITPQFSNLNQGPWKKLEEDIRSFAAKRNTLYTYVYAGTLFEKNKAPLPFADESHTVPSGFWKIVITRDIEMQPRVNAFLFPQVVIRSSKYCSKFQSSVSEIKSRTGLTFFNHRLAKGTICP